jgi:hypothetical protein
MLCPICGQTMRLTGTTAKSRQVFICPSAHTFKISDGTFIITINIDSYYTDWLTKNNNQPVSPP